MYRINDATNYLVLLFSRIVISLEDSFLSDIRKDSDRYTRK